MLKINHKTKFQVLSAIALILGVAFLFQYLTFIPEYSSAEEISTPVYSSKEDTRTLSDITYMQEMTSGICDRSVYSESKSLVDARDEQNYQVTKLIGDANSAESECWMTQNMNYDGGLRMRTHTNYGGYYNFTNAIIVCSGISGWRLPTSTQYSILTSKVSNGIQLTAPPYNFLYSNGSNGYTSSGDYRSSSEAAGQGAYFLRIDSNGMKNAYYNSDPDINRTYGMSVRCVARDDVPDGQIQETLIPNPNVSVMVSKILTLEVTDKEVNIEPKTSEVMTGEFAAKVSSNAGYDIALSAAEGKPTAMVNDKDALSNIPASSEVKAGDNGWGIRCAEDEDCVVKSYNALTLYNDPKVYFSSASGVAGKETKFEVGIGISPSLPSGTYSTNILVTVSQK